MRVEDANSRDTWYMGYTEIIDCGAFGEADFSALALKHA